MNVLCKMGLGPNEETPCAFRVKKVAERVGFEPTVPR